ncbi:MAG: WD40 repeat [Glomeribacter sp. 1016415]|nr:WD40 repeat [Glomeribacter sp. 1016415]
MLNPISSSATASYGVAQKSLAASLLSLPIEVREKIENHLQEWEQQNLFKALTTVTRDGEPVNSPVLKLHLLQQRIAVQYHQSLVRSDESLRAFVSLHQLRRLWESGQLAQLVEKSAFFELVRVVDNPEIFKYLREKIQQEPELKNKLLSWVERSKTEEVQPMAANALTLLVKSGVQFNGADLKEIRVPGADLSFGIFDSAQLQGADLRRANLRNSWLREANLSGSQMAGVQLGGPYRREEELRVNSSAGGYSPDGKWSIVGFDDGKVSVYSTSTGEKIYTLEGHPGPVRSVLHALGSGNWDETTRLWEVRSGATWHSFEGHTGSVSSVVYSPNGEQLASGSYDCTVCLWDAQSGVLRHTLEGHINWVTSVAYSPSGEQLASVSRDHTVRLWNAQSGAHGYTLEGHTEAVWSVAYSPNGAQLASGSVDRTVRLWDVESGVSGRILEGHTNAVWSVAYSPNGAQLASGSVDRTVRLWDMESGVPGHILEGHTKGVSSVVYSPNGAQLASGSWDNTVRLWDVQSGAPGRILEGHTGGIMYSPSGEQLASVSFDVTVRLWDVQTGQCQMVIQNCGPVTSVAWKETSGRHYLGIGGADKSVRQWEVKREGEDYKAVLCWSTTHKFMTVRGAYIEGVQGLGRVEQSLLQQRGAVGEPCLQAHAGVRRS